MIVIPNKVKARNVIRLAKYLSITTTPAGYWRKGLA